MICYSDIWHTILLVKSIANRCFPPALLINGTWNIQVAIRSFPCCFYEIRWIKNKTEILHTNTYIHTLPYNTYNYYQDARESKSNQKEPVSFSI